MIPQAQIPKEPGLYKQHKAESNGSPLVKNYARYPVEFKKGDGVNLFDSEGKKYLDFLSGIAVTGFGHNHPTINAAVEEQLNKLWHVSNLFESYDQKSLARKLVKKSGLHSVFFSNSGSEANEAAIKFARKWGNGKSNILTAVGGFHGRTMGSLSATAQFKTWEGFSPLLPGFNYIPYDDIDNIKYSITDNTIAIMVEPIQGESGVIIPSSGYLKSLREICDEYGLLLILDEIQTGIGRTGKFFAHQWDDVKPDIITLAKGIANGIPLGATIVSEKVAETITPGCHGSTFGGNPLAVAAANAVVDLVDDFLLDKVIESGKLLEKSINLIFTEKIKEVRSKGLMVGVEFVEGVSAKEIAKILLNKGIVVGNSGDSVLRLLPPLIISKNDIVEFTVIFEKVLQQI
ncbi:MAG: acetylornithine/succinylornithine family transaminase [Ignavibacteria bacterium]|jgi:predicted acetylornithine/succinylornithine family transaminase